MRNPPTDDYAFLRAVRFADAQIRQWCIRTGRQSRSGGIAYKPEDVPKHIDVPTNEDRSRAEIIAFRLEPLKYGQRYTAYLTHAKPEHRTQSDQLGCHPDMHRGVITTWTGDLLAVVTKITTFNAVCFGRDAGMKGSFWALGIDGRTYYGRHNGRAMACSLRLAKYRDEYDVQQHTADGWELVSSALTLGAARSTVRKYRENQPQIPVRLKHYKVRQS